MNRELLYNIRANRTIQKITHTNGHIKIDNKRNKSIQYLYAKDQEMMRRKFDNPIQRGNDELVQGKLKEHLQKKNETGMPDNLKAGIEGLSGFSMDDVRVHYNSSKPANVQALAYTQGTDIYVAPGQEQHVPHEAWHVAQQMAGRVVPTTEVGGLPVNDNADLEHEADVMGARANNF